MNIITAAGSFLIVGATVGEATREHSRFMVEALVPEIVTERFHGDTAAMAEAIERLRRPAQAFFPEAMEYMAGLARGTGIDRSDLLAVLFAEDLNAVPAAPRPEKCSTMVVSTDRGRVVGHNEDFWPSFLGRMAVLDLTFDGFPRTVSLNYPGHLPHLAGSLNEAGIAVTNNSLWPPATPGLSKQFKHFRAALSRTMAEAQDALCSGPQSLTDHYTVISDREGVARSIEVSHALNSESDAEARDIGDGPFCHTNSVLYLPLREPDPNPAAKCRRLAALQELGRDRPPSSAQEMFDLLCRPDGILNRGPGNDLLGRPNSVTLATVVMRPRTNEFWCRQYGLEDEYDARVVL
ncbi:MAG TPA: C45 family peptidase [Candidatus Eisenbacteria bacterium]|jgi:hypothetical protein|nr:C45 family peptidase [Candidatus Eisenbacteria bacterium]